MSNDSRTKEFYNSLDDINILCKYLYKEPDNYIIVETVAGAKLKINMNSQGDFYAKVVGSDSDPVYYDNISIPTMLDIIDQLKSTPSENKRYANVWEGIKLSVVIANVVNQ